MDLQQINEISSLSIIIEDARRHRRYKALVKRHQDLKLAQPVSYLQVPNKLLALWSKMCTFWTCGGCNSVFKHSALANDRIKGSEIALKVGVQSLDTRLQKETSRITNLFKKHKKGKPLRKLEKGSTHVMVFENEMVHLPQNASSTTAIALELHGKDTTASN